LQLTDASLAALPSRPHVNASIVGRTTGGLPSRGGRVAENGDPQRFYDIANGMADDATDGWHLSFWSVERILQELGCGKPANLVLQRTALALDESSGKELDMTRISRCALALLALSCGRSRAPAAENRAPEPKLDVGYFRGLLDREGPKGIESRLYVAPPHLMPPLLEGIESGAPEWLEVYGRFRRGLRSPGSTADYLDESLADALGNATEAVLSYLGRNREPSPVEICGRTGFGSRAGILEPRQMLMLVRRQQSVSRLNNPEFQNVRAKCLSAMTELVHRQLRIYLVSYGAEDSASTDATRLSASDKRELDAVLTSARLDPTLRARGDGIFPDGPFRKAAVPKEIIDRCARNRGAVANAEDPWQYTDVIGDRPLPKVRLLNSCKVAADEWEVTCEHGGFAPYLRRVRVRQDEGRWALIQEDGGGQSYFAGDPWVDCRSLRPAPRSTPGGASPGAGP
jgi:hypothetical protein